MSFGSRPWFVEDRQHLQASVDDQPLQCVLGAGDVAFDQKVIGARQHAQYDSSRTSLPTKCGIFDTACERAEVIQRLTDSSRRILQVASRSDLTGGRIVSRAVRTGQATRSSLEDMGP